MASAFRLVAVFACLLLLPSCATTSAVRSFQPTTTEARLASLIAQRLEVSREVAWIKFLNDLPVRDPKREQELLASLEKKAGAFGLSPQAVGVFFRSQINASCQVQERLIGKWARGGTLPAYFPRDLKRDIRPELDHIGNEMLASLAQLGREPKRAGYRPAVEALLREQGFSWLEARTATSALP